MSEEIRHEFLEQRWAPLPPALVESVLQVVEQDDAGLRRKGALLLQPTLTLDVVERLRKVALRNADTGLKSRLTVRAGGEVHFPFAQVFRDAY